jgi:predicted RNase H-like nuclease
LGNKYRYGVCSTFRDLLNQFPKHTEMLIDIPIGLPSANQTPRICDVQARKMLNLRRSSVFPAPLREILSATSYEQANNQSRRLSGKGLSRQTYGIFPKIKEVDDVLQSDADLIKIVRESHPEICFLSLANGRPMKSNKKTDDGFKERVEILKTYWESTEDAIAEASLWRRGKQIARDDIVDALVLAAVATHPRNDLVSIPQNPPIDKVGLPMQMIYLSYK